MSSKNFTQEINRNEPLEINKDNEADINNEEVCICKGNCFGKMIACEECFEWYHYDCVGIKENEEPDNWICDTCKNKIRVKNNKKRKNAKKSSVKS